MENKIRSLLINLGLSTPESLVAFYPKLRDYNDISILKCLKSGVLLLSRTDHLDESYYVSQKGYSYWASDRNEAIAKVTMDDTQRRFDQFNYLIRNKKWLDIGTGPGDILERMGTLASKVIAVEPQTDVRNNLKVMNYEVYPFAKDVPDSDFDIATVFLVLQQLFDPITELNIIRQKLIPGGKIVVEVNNANDFLFSQLNLESFKSYAFQKSVLMTIQYRKLYHFLIMS